VNKPAITFLFIFLCISAPAQYKKYSFQQPKMGSPFNIVIYSLDSARAQQAAAATFKMIDTLNNIFSDYLPQSELNKLCATAGSGKWVNVSEPLFSILIKAYHASEMSNGTFDVTLSPVVRLWRTARREKRLPDRDSLHAAKQKVGYKNIELDTLKKCVRLKKAGMQLDLGGIAKGETAQRAYGRLSEAGFPYSLLDAGGDIVAGNVPPEIQGWRVGINLPETEELMNRQLLLRNKAVTTSGDLYQYLELNGVRYSHIINPATGWALTTMRNVTVIADNGADADWLTKACSILPVQTAIKLVKKFPSAEVQIAVLENNKPRFYRSKGFTKYFSRNDEK
jgi:thiamine biosynthesis lipoprotein